MTTRSESDLTFSSDSVSLHPPPFPPSIAVSLVLSVQCCKLPLFIFFSSIAHILLFCIFFSFSLPVWVYHRFCYTSSQYIYTSWCHTSGDSLFTCTRIHVSMLPSLTQWFKPADMWLLVAELQVQINLSSPAHKETIVSSQPQTQAELKWAWKYWYSNDKSLRVYLLVCVHVCSCVSVCLYVHSLRVHGHRPVCHVALSWYADILVVRLSALTLGLTGCIMPSR